MRERRSYRPIVSRRDFAARFAAEKARQQRRYCDAFALWQDCKSAVCRRERACRGDANACLKRALAGVPHHAQAQAREDLLAATPRNIGAPERAARQCMPLDFYLESAGNLAADYLARFKPKSRPNRYRKGA